jgi:cytochrome c oxidase assembly protein subunit 15
MIFFQIILGAFVSGLDAGRLYQTWPLMNYNYFPDDVSINNFKDFFNFNNHGLVQFYHRNLAYLISIYIVIAGLYIYINDIKKVIKPFNYVILILVFQIILGITTLTSGLNIYLASTHQICSLLLILSVINLYYEYIK